ncbi:hypothetical protein JL721_8295 [Aureococcus anophagefferens]|nr:hypothetical protein JL721_8295 [Aureococcus anophagefferens]
MEQGSNLSKEQLLAYIKKQKKAIAALTEDKAAKQVIIEDLKNEFASLEPKLRNRVAQLQEENDALRSADAPADAPRPTPPRGSRPPPPTPRGSAPPRRRRDAARVVELGRARDAALAEAEAARRAALDADARAAAADALEAAKAGAKAALETMRVEGDATRAEAVAAAVDAVKAEAKARIQAVKDRLAQVQAFAKKRDEAAKAFEDAPADGRLEAAEEKVKKLQDAFEKYKRRAGKVLHAAERPPPGAGEARAADAAVVAAADAAAAARAAAAAADARRRDGRRRDRRAAPPPAPPTPRRSPSPPPRDDGWGDDGWEDAADAPADAAADEPPDDDAPPLKPRSPAGDEGELERLRSQAAVYSSAVATLERHLKRERDLRTSEDASDNVLFLKNSVVRFLCAKDDKEMQDMLGAMASILSLAPHEVQAIEAAAAKPGLVSRILDAEIRVPFFGR